MKKILFLAIASVCFTNAYSQIKFGVTAGLHSSNISSARGITSDAVGLFHGGFLIDLKIHNSDFHIRGEALYTSFGYKNSNISAIDKGGDLLGDIGNEKINYLQIPVLASYQFGLAKMNFNLGAGPYIAFETSESLKIANGGDTFRNTIFPIYTSGRSSVLGGGEVYASLELAKFFIALQYQHSFNYIYRNIDNNNTKWEIGTIGFSLGFFLK